MRVLKGMDFWVSTTNSTTCTTRIFPSAGRATDSGGWLVSSPSSGTPASASACPTVPAAERISTVPPFTPTVSGREGV